MMSSLLCGSVALGPGRRGQPAAALRPPGRALKLPGHLLIRARRGLGPVPGAAVGIDQRIGDLRQRVVRVVSFLNRRRPVGGRAHQRMPEPHPCAELHQARLDRRRRRLKRDPQMQDRRAAIALPGVEVHTVSPLTQITSPS